MKTKANLKIAVIGAGLGGCAAAALLQQAGYNVTVYEQAPAFSRLGAGINLSPNVTRVLRKIGIEPQLRALAAEPKEFISRASDTGEVTFVLPLGDEMEKRYGAPYYTVHRGDFHELLLSAVDETKLRMDKRLSAVEQDPDGVTLNFVDGTKERVDLVIGADGLNSTIRELLLGPEMPRYTGYVAHRAIFPASRIQGMELDDCTKWWSAEHHLIVYYLTKARDEVYLVTGVPRPTWDSKSGSKAGTQAGLLEDFKGFEPRAQRILEACTDVSEWALFERDPLPIWSDGRVVILGDACHPMKPHMGQGAAMAIEDAAMLVRCLEASGADDYRAAFELYRKSRIDRASEVQAESSRNRWLREDTDVEWVFGYDVFTAPLGGATA